MRKLYDSTHGNFLISAVVAAALIEAIIYAIGR